MGTATAPPARARPPRTAVRSPRAATAPAWTGAMVLLATLIVVSTADQVHLAVGPFSLRPAQGIGIVVLVVAAVRGWLPADGPVRLAWIGAGAAWLFALPSIVTFGIERASIPLQLAINLFLLAGTITLARTLTPNQLRRTVACAAALLAVVAVVTLFTSPPPLEQQAARVLGFPRARGWFEEPTWLAIMATALVAAALQLRMYHVAIALSGGVLALFTRTAVAALAVAWLCEAARRRVVPTAFALTVIVALWIAAIWQVSALLGDTWISGSSSLATRASDIAMTRAINGDTFLPFGGSELVVYDPSRDRTLPATSGVLPFDLIWKLGLGGFAVLLLLGWISLRGVAGTVRMGAVRFVTTPAGSFVSLALPISFLNSAVGRPFLWVMAGVLAVAIEANRRSGGPARPRGRRAPVA